MGNIFKVVKVIDGDTIECKKIGLFEKTIRVRLYGIDCPELKPKILVNDRALHMEKALFVKNYMINKIQGKYVKVYFEKNNKGKKIKSFDRYIANVVFKGENLSVHLLGKNYAKECDSKTIRLWTKTDLLLIF